VVSKEVFSAGALDFKSLPDSRCATKRVDVLSGSAALSDLELGKGMIFRYKEDLDIAMVCAEVYFSSNCAAVSIAFFYSKHASERRREHAQHIKAVILETLDEFDGVSISRIIWN